MIKVKLKNKKLLDRNKKYKNIRLTDKEWREDLNLERALVRCMLKALNTSKYISQHPHSAARKCGLVDRTFFRHLITYEIDKDADNVWFSGFLNRHEAAKSIIETIDV